MSRDPFAQYDAAYVLGALSPADRRAYEEHLRSCDRCADAVAEVAGLPGLLATADAAVLEGGRSSPPVPDTLLPHLLGGVRRDGRSRRRRAIVAAAAAAAVVAASSAALTALVDRDDGARPTESAASRPAVPMQQMSQLDGPGISATLGLEEVPWGTRLTMTCRYQAAPAGPSYDGGAAVRYVLVVRTHAGDEERVASWVGGAGDVTTLTGATAWRPDDIAAVEVRSSSGRPLLRLSV